MMADSAEGGPMFGLWTRVERQRKQRQKCRIIGTSLSVNSTEQKKKSWKHIMKEKQDRESEK